MLSAGLTAMIGGGATPEAVEAARELGADLSGHRARAFTDDLATAADSIVAMAPGHLLALAHQFPEAFERCRLLRADGGEIADPIGCAQEVYRQCAAEIAQHLGPLVSEWIQS